MIAQEKGSVTLICDNCGEEISGLNNLDEAIQHLENKGWDSDHGVNLEGKDDWIDICPRCIKKQK